MEDDNQENIDQPSTSHKENRRDSSLDTNESENGQITKSKTASEYSDGSKIEVANLDPAIKTVGKSRKVSRYRVKSRRAAGRVEKRKRVAPKRQGNRKMMKRKQRSRQEKKAHNPSISTIFTRLSSSYEPGGHGCTYCGHRCCRRRYTKRCNKRKVKKVGVRRKRSTKIQRLIKRNAPVKVSECTQAGSCSQMLSPLFVTTNSAPGEVTKQKVDYREISPQMIYDVIQYLMMWRQHVPTSMILDYIMYNYPVNPDKDATTEDLAEKLNVAVLMGLISRTSNDTWSLRHAYQREHLTDTHVSLFWKMYSDTLKPITKKESKENPNT